MEATKLRNVGVSQVYRCNLDVSVHVNSNTVPSDTDPVNERSDSVARQRVSR